MYWDTENNIFHFLSDKNGYFCEAPTKNEFQKWITSILQNIIPYFMYNSSVVYTKNVF
jgi:hypothetical protein